MKNDISIKTRQIMNLGCSQQEDQQGKYSLSGTLPEEQKISREDCLFVADVKGAMRSKMADLYQSMEGFSILL